MRALLLLLALAAAGCVRQPQIFGDPVDPRVCTEKEVTHSAFLVGDAGLPRLPLDGSPRLVDPLLSALREDVGARAGELGADRVYVIYLGDNVYPDGLPPEGRIGRRRGERILEAQVAASEPARAIFTLGNHDWHVEGPEGWDRALAQRRFLEQYAPRVTMEPPGGCAGPDEVIVGPHLRFVFVDPIGFSHLVVSPEEHASACSARTALEAYRDLAAHFDADATGGRHTVLALHHPLITSGPHGGHFTLKQHIFPLTDFWSWAWVPLPIIGSVYPISRQLGVTGTDSSSRIYQSSISGIYRATRPGVPIAFVGGHEHSLQLHRDVLGAYYIVSGAGSAARVDRVEPTDTAMLAAARAGYMRLDALANGSLELSAFAVDRSGDPERLMRHCLAEGPHRRWRRPPRRERH